MKCFGAPGRKSPSPHPRRGAIVVLMALLMIVLVAMAAFAIDIGYICRVQAELQNAADAAALAGAQKTLQAVVRSDPDTDEIAVATISSGREAAEEYALRHWAGGVKLALLDEDVVIGYQETPGSEPVTAWTLGQEAPNCVQVTTRRSSEVNGVLPLFFGTLLGKSSTDLAATAVAAFDTGKYTVTGFKSNPGGPHGKLLPIAISIDTWNDFLNSGNSPDGTRKDLYTLDLTLPNSPVQAPDNVSSGSDHTPELNGVYPSETTPGNFSLVQFDPTSSSQSTGAASDWIRHGPSPSDMAAFGSNGIQATPDSPLTLPSGTGWKSSVISDLESIVGEPRIVPLYSSYTGSGSTASFQIVGFAGISIVHAEGTGSNMTIVFQPTIVIDDTATTSSSATSTTEFVYPAIPLSLVR